MSEDPFGKWWPCLRKHEKRLQVWLPHVRTLKAGLDGRGLRYFTLCARPMIDVYLLVRENLITLDPRTRRIDGVSFCELEPAVMAEMKELLGVEEAAFGARLEDLVLFKDDAHTLPHATPEAIAEYLDQEGERLAGTAVEAALELKRKHLEFHRLFPFDFLNLDFCDRYYPKPPDVLRIHRTVERLLDWQNDAGGAEGAKFRVDRFVVAITCRLDDALPPEAIDRLKTIVAQNRDNHPEYATALGRLNGTTLDQWLVQDRLDFFMSAWPKEIARLARDKAWDLKILDHVHYDRTGDNGNAYDMVCLVVEFTKAKACKTYLAAVTAALDEQARRELVPIAETTKRGRQLLTNLRAVVALRNEQARHYRRAVLPDPAEELIRLRASGVKI
jgi:hypothetical protein